MVRISKQGRKRNKSPKRRQHPAVKTGPKLDILPLGYKEHQNALSGSEASKFFIPKIG